ncbi:MAG: DUF2933 domain-containing protein [Chloroflexota bacterium]
MDTGKPERKHLSKHSLIMLLCCLVPLAIIAVLWAAGVSGRYLFLGVLLLCPLLHIVMMRGMHGGGEHDHH